MITPDQYQQSAERTEPDRMDYLDIRDRFSEANVGIRLLHHTLGMSTEVGEVNDIIKRYIIYGSSLDITHVKEELGDLMWYVAGLCNALDISLDEVLSKNIEKLKLRYPKSFNYIDAVNRDTSKERDILEK